MNWNEQEEQLAYFLVNDGRIKEPKGRLKVLMTLFKPAKGSRAPALSFGGLLRQNTILVFYEPGCGNREIEIKNLEENYPLLKEKGYDVVSISIDMDETFFQNDAA